MGVLACLSGLDFVIAEIVIRVDLEIVHIVVVELIQVDLFECVEGASAALVVARLALLADGVEFLLDTLANERSQFFAFIAALAVPGLVAVFRATFFVLSSHLLQDVTVIRAV